MSRASTYNRYAPARRKFRTPERRTWRIAPADEPERTVTVRASNLVEALREARNHHFGEDARLVAEEVF